MSKIKVNEIEKASGSGITVPTGTSFTITDGLASASLPTVPVNKGGTNLTSFTAGDVLYATGSTTLAKLAKGTAGQYLKMNSGATAPEWATASGGFVATADDDLNFAGLYDVEDLQRACFEIQGTSFDSDSTNNADRTGESQMYVRQVDSNNDGLFIRIKKNGSIQNLQVA